MLFLLCGAHALLLAPTATGPRPPRPPTARAAAADLCAAGPIDVVVRRGDGGGLGVLVDQDNVVVTVTAQPGLQVGDVIVGVDGEPLSGRSVGQALAPGKAEYLFSITRPSADVVAASLERVLLQLVRDASASPPKLLCFADDDEQAARAETLVTGLEEAAAAAGGPAGGDALGGVLRSGFWRLALVSDAATARGGLSGYGLAPFCSVMASFQAFIDLKGEPTVADF